MHTLYDLFRVMLTRCIFPLPQTHFGAIASAGASTADLGTVFHKRPQRGVLKKVL